MEQLKFFKGKEEDLLKKTDIEAGAIYHCIDTKNTYLGTNQNGLIPYSSAIGRAANKSGGEIFNDYVNNTAREGAHAEGGSTKAEGRFSHAEGEGTIARGIASHAEGKDCEAVGDYSHAEGIGTFARANAQNVIGKYNEKDINWNYVHIVGNGNSDVDRKNIHTLDWNGNAWFAGNLKIGGAGPDDPNAKEVSGNDPIILMDDIFSGYDHFYTNIAQGRVNPEKPLEISTYDGSGQLTHPCVRYFPEGFGNHQFWMTATPYPYSALDLENPCVWYSDDGYEWSADGIPNPLDLPLMVNRE